MKGVARVGGPLRHAEGTLSTISYYAIVMAARKSQRSDVSEQQIQAWADEAQAGYDVQELRRRGRPPMGEGPSAVVPVRLDPELLDALLARAAADHMSRSEAIRAAIRAWLGAA